MKKHDCGECEEQDFTVNSLRDTLWSHYLQEKKILINGKIDDSLIEKAVMQIYSFNEIDDANQLALAEGTYARTPIKVFINSEGGSFNECFSLISAIATSRTPVYTIALGKAFSAGFLILLSGHARLAQPYSQLMYHQGAAGIVGEFNKVIEYAEHYKVCQKIVEDYVIARTKIKQKKLTEIFNQKNDWYVSTDEALKLGIIDGIYPNALGY